jgi:hypothetical protein
VRNHLRYNPHTKRNPKHSFKPKYPAHNEYTQSKHNYRRAFATNPAKPADARAEPMMSVANTPFI